MTGENVFSRSPRAPLNCTAAMDIFDNSICAPYIIEVVAVNMNGNSYSASETVGNISEGEFIMLLIGHKFTVDDYSLIIHDL